jgi:hypothetical protein
MNRNFGISRLGVIAATALLVIAAPAAAQLYKWVDKDGRTQYTDTPPPADARSTQQIRTQAAGTTPPATGGIAAQEKDFQKRRADAAKAGTKAEEDAKAAEANAERCTQARGYLATLNDGGRIKRTRADGQQEFLDDAAIESEKKRAQAAMQDSCKP